MRRIFIHAVYLVIFSIGLAAQEHHYTFLGAGNHEGITVTASGFIGNSTPDKTINGSGLDAKFMEASRFLCQAGFGGKKEEIEEVMEMGFENWIEDQFNKPNELMVPIIDQIMHEIFHALDSIGEDTTEYFGPWGIHFNYAWWTRLMAHDDVLRLKVAQALSEILVISMNSEILNFGRGAASYYDMLLRNAFGNYKDLLMEVTLHPMMGYYLSHYNNPKTDTVENIRPDENYAREIMQLFTIGLYELDIDGTPILDSEGKPIPTYDNNDIKEFAKVFTGLGMGEVEYNREWPPYPIFGPPIYFAEKTVPMAMYEDYHEPGEKYLLNGFVVPAGQSGMQDVADAVDHLFNHPNVGPFLAYRLIQRLVKSNPTPAYVARVASAFNDNGQGVRGDMKAVVKAILLDEEARSADWFSDPSNGMIRPPLYRLAHLFKTIDLIYPYPGRYWNNGWDILDEVKHHPLGSPTVFNFYPPNFQPIGPLYQEGLVSPEMKIHNTAASVRYINRIFMHTFWETAWWSWENGEIDDPVEIDYSYYENISDDPEYLINELDKLLTHGNLSDDTRQIIRDNLAEFYWTWDDWWRYFRARMAVYLIMISPDYVTFK